MDILCPNCKMTMAFSKMWQFYNCPNCRMIGPKDDRDGERIKKISEAVWGPYEATLFQATDVEWISWNGRVYGRVFRFRSSEWDNWELIARHYDMPIAEIRNLNNIKETKINWFSLGIEVDKNGFVIRSKESMTKPNPKKVKL